MTRTGQPHLVAAGSGLKGTIPAEEASRALAAGLREACPSARVTDWPVADGGPGTVAFSRRHLAGEIRHGRARDPYGAPVDTTWSRLPSGIGVIEAAQACGQRGALRRLDPLGAGTSGVADLLTGALDARCRPVWIGVGGSVSTDGGAGLLQALGARLLDRRGRELPAGGGALVRLERIDLSGLDPRVREAGEGGELRVLADVRNPLLGPRGAARVYAPQKGAGDGDVALLERSLARWAGCLERATGRRLRDAPGAGASGGLAFGLAAGLGAVIVPGSGWLLDAGGFDTVLAGADLVVTCEGRWDGAVHPGKATAEVVRRAGKAGVKAAVVCGRDSSGGRDGEDPPRPHIAEAASDDLTVDRLARMTRDCALALLKCR